MNFDELSQYEIDGELQFIEIEHGFVYAEINNARAHATVSTYSGQLLSYRPKDQQEDLLFVSDKAYYQQGKAIKGGIPVCWPWFGPDPENRGRPAHGFVRNRQWQVSGSESLADGSTKIILSITDNEATRALWPHPFRLDIEITVGATLRVELVTHNTGNDSITISQALHSYFRVGDITRASVLGLDGINYLDKASDSARKTQSGPLTISSEVDRIYTDTSGELRIDDAALERKITITSSGCSTTVVWNPWVEIAASMADLDDDDYLQMLCVETANAGPETVTIAAGDCYRLTAEYSIS
ncbi:MAG: D-hexose-6-phosphate mutarotase [Gammaproteobacteria bacterium]|nr:D-hexose-6-phosphate mutarotase [Gammaproteobacteria bacterium]